MKGVAIKFVLLASTVLGTGLDLAPNVEDCITITGQSGSDVLVHYDYTPTEIRVDTKVFKKDAGKPKLLQKDSFNRVETFNLTNQLNPTGPTYFDICFKNTHSQTPAQVRFVIQADKHDYQYDIATSHHAEGLFQAASKLRNNLQLLLAHQEFQMGAEVSHKKAMNDTHKSIYRWTSVRIIGLVGLAAVQVTYIRRLFSGPKTIL